VSGHSLQLSEFEKKEEELVVVFHNEEGFNSRKKGMEEV
jgi:hypothetical protein